MKILLVALMLPFAVNANAFDGIIHVKPTWPSEHPGACASYLNWDGRPFETRLFLRHGEVKEIQNRYRERKFTLLADGRIHQTENWAVAIDGAVFPLVYTTVYDWRNQAVTQERVIYTDARRSAVICRDENSTSMTVQKILDYADEGPDFKDFKQWCEDADAPPTIRELINRLTDRRRTSCEQAQFNYLLEARYSGRLFITEEKPGVLSDLRPLRMFRGITNVDLWGRWPTTHNVDYASLASLNSVEALEVSGIDLTGAHVLGQRLRALQAYSSSSGDTVWGSQGSLEVLGPLPNLETAYIWGDQPLQSLNGLEGSTRLKRLVVSGGAIRTLDPIRHLLPNLDYLNVCENSLGPDDMRICKIDRER